METLTTLIVFVRHWVVLFPVTNYRVGLVNVVEGIHVQ